MKNFNAFFLLLIFILLSSTIHAQLSPSSRIYGGYMGASFRENSTNLTLYPYAQYFLSRHFSAGGFLQVSGNLSNGVQLITATPELRYYFNPDDPKVNWFVYGTALAGIYNKDNENLRIPFRMNTGIGILAPIAQGFGIESKLYVSFLRQTGADLFDRPMFGLSSYLIFYRSKKTSESVESATTPGKGSWMVTGSSFSGDYSTLTNLRSFNLQLAPSAGYFLSDRFMLGMQLPLSYSILSTNANFSFFRKIQNFSWTFIPFVRYYTNTNGQKARPFVEMRSRLNYRKEITTLSGQGGNEKYNSYDGSAHLGGGVDLFVTPWAALEMGLFLGKNLQEGDVYGTLNIGFQYFLRK